MLGRKKKPTWSSELDALPDGERTAAMVGIYFLKLSGSGLKKFRVYPEKDRLPFEALVARVAIPWLGPIEDYDAATLFDVGHCLRDGATVLSGSQLTRGPYGDLLYRVDQGCSAIVHRVYERRVGSQLLLDPANTVEPPRLRLFLSALAARYADGLLAQPSGTTAEDGVVETLSQLAASPEEPRLVTAVRSQEPLALVAHGRDWFLSEADILDMTRDEQLARSLGHASAI